MSFSRAMPDELRTQDRVVGLFVLVAMALVLYLVLQQTYFQSQKKDWLRLNSVMSNSFGIKQGSLIELSGVTIGNVDSVVLRPDARVEVVMRFDDRYSSMLSVDSKLKVGSQLGLDTVLSGGRLELLPGQSTERLADNATIEIVEPRTLGEMMEGMMLEDLVRQLRNIVANVEKLSGDLVERRHEIARATENISEFTDQLVRIGTLAPGFLDRADMTLAGVRGSLGKLNKAIDTLMPPMSELLHSTNRVMAATHGTLGALQPSLEMMPELLVTTNEAAQSVNRLSLQLSRHWLLNAGGGPDEKAGIYTTSLPADDELYDMNTN